MSSKLLENREGIAYRGPVSRPSIASTDRQINETFDRLQSVRAEDPSILRRVTAPPAPIVDPDGIG